ncbi:Puromycin-sensitive aminopeptidase [Lamellibrachia satsuma]|nr:Puromycin-sensitive aminopeptidase [Lamellibrachia satsuma]
MSDKKAFQRLPQDVVPHNYALRLTPDLNAFTFEGQELISVKVTKATSSVTLNSADIQVKGVQYQGGKQEFNTDVKVIYSKEDETVTFKFPDALQPGEGTITVDFTGELNDKMKGFYRSKYTTPEGKERYAAVTQFEATDARRAFPCWDEPAMKATFDITLVVPQDRISLSNMPVKTEKESDGKRVVEYERTPIMSTYLLAFIVGEYDYVEAKDADGVLVRVYTPTGKKEQGEFALQVAVKTLPFYKDYFKIAYPLPKIDLIALADFASGAMENWGLVTYRETALLIDSAHSSSAAKQWVALVVGHELAHQWFGNLVTMEWWTHLWLNEGFASWIEYLCVDYCFPEYDIWTQFAATDFTRALELDALCNSHPIEVPVGHPAEVDEIFDVISYSKGASVIRMLHDYIGDEHFRKGMNLYLNRHKYKNTFTEDLWAALAETSDEPVQEIMSTWTKQMGFPVLKVSEEKNGNTQILTIRQEKFSADGTSDGNDCLWMVPVSISTASSPNKAMHRLVLDQQEATVTLNDVKSSDWVKLNTGAVGFYRTQYSSGMLESLLPSIKDGSLPPRDRLGLGNDLFALARAGEASTVDFLKVAQAFVNETNYTVWSDLLNGLATLSTLMQYTDYHANYLTYNCRLLADIAKNLGWDPVKGETHLDAMLRSLVIGRLGRSGHKDTIAEAKKRFAAHCSSIAVMSADLRAPVYATVLAHGATEEYEQMLKLLSAADMHEEKVRILRSLGAVRDKKLIQRVLDLSLSKDVRSQDTVFVIGGVTGSAEGRELAWKFVQDRWNDLHDRYKGGFLLARLIKFTTENFVTEEKAKEIEAFFVKNPAPAGERTVQQSLENIRLNKKQLERDGPAIKTFLQSLK